MLLLCHDQQIKGAENCVANLQVLILTNRYIQWILWLAITATTTATDDFNVNKVIKIIICFRSKAHIFYSYLYMDSYTIESIRMIFFRFWSDWFSLSVEVALSNQMQTKIYSWERRIFVYLVIVFFFDSLSLFSLCITDSPLAQAPQMMLRLRNWFYLRLCVLFFCAQNWATLTNHFEKSDFVRIIHLFNSWDLFTFSSIHSSPFALSLSLSIALYFVLFVRIF